MRPRPAASAWSSSSRRPHGRRDHLARWAAPLADEGRIDADALERIRAGSGHADLGQDLIILVSLFRNRWDDLHALGVVTEEDLDRSTLIGSSLFHMTALRNEAVTLSPSESSLRIRRAWTLLDRAYSECRSAVQYLRRKEGDADDIAPTLRRSVDIEVVTERGEPARFLGTDGKPGNTPPPGCEGRGAMFGCAAETMLVRLDAGGVATSSHAIEGTMAGMVDVRACRCRCRQVIMLSARSPDSSCRTGSCDLPPRLSMLSDMPTPQPAPGRLRTLRLEPASASRWWQAQAGYRH
jgi:hypothetical protein